MERGNSASHTSGAAGANEMESSTCGAGTCDGGATAGGVTEASGGLVGDGAASLRVLMPFTLTAPTGSGRAGRGDT